MVNVAARPPCARASTPTATNTMASNDDDLELMPPTAAAITLVDDYSDRSSKPRIELELEVVGWRVSWWLVTWWSATAS